MIGEVMYVVGIGACFVSGTAAVIELGNSYKHEKKEGCPKPFTKWFNENKLKLLFVALIWSIGYAYAVALYIRHFHFGDTGMLNSYFFELRTLPVTICVVGLAWQMVVRVFRWLIGIDKDLKW